MHSKYKVDTSTQQAEAKEMDNFSQTTMREAVWGPLH